MAHSARSIANQFLERAGPNGLDPMKLLKLTYLAQGWMLGLYGAPLIADEVEAWRYGPVFRQVYNVVSGWSQFSGRLTSFDNRPLEHRESHMVDQIWKIYGGMTGLQLSSLTHQPGSPWDIIYRERGQNSVIPKSLMQDFYSKQARGRS